MAGSKRNSGIKVKAGYVGVTAGETYTIYGRNVAAGATIEWSDEINTHAVDVTI